MLDMGKSIKCRKAHALYPAIEKKQMTAEKVASALYNEEQLAGKHAVIKCTNYSV
jgi:hypothetical protein